MTEAKLYNERIEYCKNIISERVSTVWDLANYKSEDNKILMQSIYYVIWNSDKNNIYSLPELDSLDDVLQGGKYGGETINTYSTHFGGNDEKIKLYNFNDEEKQIIKNFKEKYLTVGNFMVLPKGKTTQTLNQIKIHYKDFADLFYYDLFETNKLDDIKEKNNFYFKVIKNAKEFCTKNFLEPYFYIKNNTYFSNKDIFMRNHLDEKDFLINYAKTASQIIDYRTYKICCILKEKLK